MRGLIFTFLLFPVFCFSQKGLKLQTATWQGWSGGVAGYVGVNYYMDFTCSPKDSIVIDSIYINNNAYAVVHSNNASNVAFWFKRDKKHVTLGLQEAHFQCTYPIAGDTIVQKKQAIKIKGAALVVYHVNGKKKKISIPSFKVLPPLSYP